MITSFFKVKEGKGGAAAAAPSSKRGQKSTAAAGGAGAEAVEEDAVEEVSVEAEGGSRGGKRGKAAPAAGDAEVEAVVPVPAAVSGGAAAVSGVPPEIASAVHPSWFPFFAAEIAKPYWGPLQAYVAAARKSSKVYPPAEDVFTAFRLTPFDGVRVVILGQDPYHGAGQAHGLSFSVAKGVATPPSLRNMINEAKSDVGIRPPTHGNLEAWAKQGVFMLNAVLTVKEATPNAHKGQGWEKFTSAAIAAINAQRKDVVFMLWGKPAQAVALKIVSPAKQHLLQAAHPSPLSASNGFFGCKHYSKANAFLKSKGLPEIDWNL